MNLISKRGTQIVAPLMFFAIAFGSLIKTNTTFKVVCIGVACTFAFYILAYLYKIKDWNRLAPMLFMVLLVTILFVYTLINS
jgi:fucose 4-O-acetylase-like acetyltransferase